MESQPALCKYTFAGLILIIEKRIHIFVIYHIGKEICTL